jgi:hypothetical protein
MRTRIFDGRLARPCCLALAFCSVASGFAFAQDAASKPVAIPDAASLIGKTVDGDRQYAIGQQAKQSKSGDWTYGFGGDAEGGLERQASVTTGARAKSILAVSHAYDSRCKRADKTIGASLDDGVKRFRAKRQSDGGSTSQAWVSYGDAGGFGVAAKQTMPFQEIDATYLPKLDLAAMSARGQVALCPSAVAPDKIVSQCAVFSLKGFPRAFDYVCDAK